MGVRDRQLTIPDSGASGDALALAASDARAAHEPFLEHLIKGVLYVYLLSLPFKQLLFVERNGFIALLILLVVWCVVYRRHFFLSSPIDIPLLAFVGWVAFTIPFSQLPAYSLKEFGKLLQGLMIFYAVRYFFCHRTHRRSLVYLMVASACLIAAYGLAQYDGRNEQAMASFLPAEVWLTTYLVFLIPLCFGAAYGETQLWLRVLAVVAGSLAVVCLVLTKSRAGSVALLAELALLGWLLRRRKAVVIGMAAAILITSGLWLASLTKTVLPETGVEVMSMKNDTFSIVHRFDIWKFALNEITQHPLVGIGYGKDAFRQVYGSTEEVIEPGHGGVRKAGVHNIVLYYALHVGIPGAILFVWLAVQTMKTFFIGVKESRDPYSYGIMTGVLIAVAGALIRFQFDLMLVGTLAVLFWTLLAIGMMHGHDRSDEDPVPR